LHVLTAMSKTQGPIPAVCMWYLHDSYLAVRLSLIFHKVGTLFYYDN